MLAVWLQRTTAQATVCVEKGGALRHDGGPFDVFHR
jgi:hypothetical protein